MVTRADGPARAWATAVRCMRAAACALLLVLGAAPSTAAQETADDLLFLEELARAFEGGGTFGAQRDLAEYLEDFPESVAAHTLAAEVAYRRGRIDEAFGHLEAAGDDDSPLRADVLLRLGRYEDVLALSDDATLPPVRRARLRVTALDALGRRVQAKTEAREAYASIDNRALDGAGLVDLGAILLFLRRFELANQALVFADRELNGAHGPDYHVEHPEALLLLAQVYEATRQTGQGGPDRTLTVLADILAADPGNVDALVIMAQTYIYGMNGRAAEDALDRALARDPSHPGALLLRGRTRLLARRSAVALQAAESVLEVDARHRDALALRAAALALRGVDEAPAAAAARDAYLASHPESNALDLLLGEVLQTHYRFADSVAPLERALALELDDERPLPVLAQSLAHLGRYADARMALQEHVQRSPFVYPWRANMLSVLDTLQDKVTVDTESRFRLLLPPGEREVFGVLLEERLAAARSDMAERWGVDPDARVVVEVYDVHGDFSVRTVGFEGFLAFGVCFGNVVTMLSPLSEMRGRYQWAQTALHEYAHVVTLALSRQRMPRWLSEGVSVWEEKRVHPSWARELERDVLQARANAAVFPVTRLDEAFQDGSTVMLGYYLGSLVCEVIERDFGFPALRAFVEAYGDDLSTEQAVQRALGITAGELDRRLLAYIDTVVAGRAAIRPRYDEQGKEHLRRAVQGGDDAALVELAWAYHDLGLVADREAVLERVQQQGLSSPSLDRLLAERDLHAARREQAKARLSAWADAGQDLEADGLVELALLHLQDDEGDEARDVLRRAQALYPSDLSPRGALAIQISLAEGAGDRDTLAALLEDLVRHDEASVDARLTLARKAVDDGRIPRALELFAQAVEIEPYDPAVRLEYARHLVVHGDEVEAARQRRLVLAMRPSQMAGIRRADEAGVARIEGQLRALQEEARTLLEVSGAVPGDDP